MRKMQEEQGFEPVERARAGPELKIPLIPVNGNLRGQACIKVPANRRTFVAGFYHKKLATKGFYDKIHYYN